MAAPSSTVWGSIINEKGKIGIYTAVSSTDTQTSVTVQVWIATRYSAYDSNNTLYYDAGTTVTAATTNLGSISFSHTVNSSWSTSNQTKIYEKTYTYTRGTSSRVYKVYAKLSGIDWVDGVMYANASYTVPALAYYQVKYSANGGTGEPSAQTKWHGITLTLSSVQPSRVGYTFQKWLSSAQSQYYDPGDQYGHNASTTMTAQWAANTYTVTYNANGGTGAPANQTKMHDVALTLSSTKPTRTNFTFKGWSAAASSTEATYAAGASYTANAAITLYAVWERSYSEPTLSDVSVYRCTDAGAADDFGTYAKVAFSWACDQTQGANAVSAISIMYKAASATTWTTETVSASGTSGTVNKIIGGLSTDESYTFTLSVTDSKSGTTAISRTIGAAKFPFDVLAGGGGASFGKPATKEGALDCDFDIYANKELYDKAGQKITNGVAEYLPVSSGYIDPNSTIAPLILTGHANAPMGEGIYFYVFTVFFNAKSTSSLRAQFAIPHNQNGSMYHRYYTGSSWSTWRRHVNDDEKVVTSDCFSLSNGILTITIP